MKIVYMGTPRFAVPPLEALIEAGHEIAAVVTRTDKPAGRGKILTAPPVKETAVRAGLPVQQPKRVRDPEFIESLRRLAPDAVVVAAYGQILPKEILVLPKFGCINIHASLLPKYRGAAPINWAIIRRESETGITIMRMDEGMDTGDILLQERMPIDRRDTAGTLTEKMSRLGAALIARTLPLIEQGKLRPVRQNSAEATTAPILKKEEGLIDWSLPAAEIEARVRGFSPWPGAYTFLDGVLIKILEASATAGQGTTGVLVSREERLEVGTGRGLLRVLTIQPAGKKPMTDRDFLRGHRTIAGKKFTGPSGQE